MILIVVYLTWYCDMLLNMFTVVKVTGHHAMKAYWGAEVYLHAFLTSALH